MKARLASCTSRTCCVSVLTTMSGATGTEQAVCSSMPRGPDNFHQAHAAAGHRVELGVAAKDRDFDAQLGGGVHHQRALGHGDLAVVDG
jgi:hypothetical protein